ncbi:MAG: RNA methyltransferase [Lachnospiraceae bacterium]|nr:RNA methyltransferase [Lachnospiraceae bacterium]
MLPEKFLERMKDMLGAEYDAFVQSFEQDKYQALRINPMKKKYIEDEQCRSSMPEDLEGFHLTPVSWEENGYYYTKEDQPGKHPYHEAGVYYIQEPSAMAVVPLLEVQPGEKVLDLCAAPGGKSTQIAGYLQGEGLLVSNEIHPARAKILSENIERMGVPNACVTNETPTRLSEKFPEYFDRILVDAPCSGEGMFRKNEVACEEWSPENVELCAARQDEILDCAAQMLRPGGRLVYSTCTFATLENEGSISRFAERHPEFEVQKTWRLWPHKVQGEGHFAAVLQKSGEVAEDYETYAVGGTEPGCSSKDKELSLWWDFWKELEAKAGSALSERLSLGILLRFGDELYLAPKGMPALKGMKVMRPGLHLGTLKKNRFEPSHALALALGGEDVRHVCHLKADDSVTVGYLNGQTFNYEGDKGWYLIVVDGYSLGWGKLAGGIMKNHYPKGLRKN